MSITVVDTDTALDRDGGFRFSSNCPVCGGGWRVEGRSLGREDLPRACNEVKQAVYCPKCKLRAVIEVRLGVVMRPGPESRYGR